jgi:hypothetical protein
LLPLLGTMEKNVSFYFKRYNLTIREVNFFETLYTCCPSSLGQTPRLLGQKMKMMFFSFLLLELEMADFSTFVLQGLTCSKRKSTTNT